VGGQSGAFRGQESKFETYAELLSFLEAGTEVAKITVRDNTFEGFYLRCSPARWGWVAVLCKEGDQPEESSYWFC